MNLEGKKKLGVSLLGTIGVTQLGELTGPQLYCATGIVVAYLIAQAYSERDAKRIKAQGGRAVPLDVARDSVK